MRFDWCEWKPIGSDWPSHLRPVTKFVLHRTEGSTVAGAYSTLKSRNVPPHGISDFETGEHLQTVDTGEAGSSLWHVDRDGCLQWEIVGFSKNTPFESGEWYAALAELLERVCIPHGIPLEFTGNDWPGPEGYGKKAPQRMSFEEFYDFEGILGHQHAPAKWWKLNSRTNAHWDIGALDVARVPIGNNGGNMFITKSSEAASSCRVWFGSAYFETTFVADWEKVVGASRVFVSKHMESAYTKLELGVPLNIPTITLPELPELTPAPLSADDVARIAVAVNDEQHRRSAG